MDPRGFDVLPATMSFSIQNVSSSAGPAITIRELRLRVHVLNNAPLTPDLVFVDFPFPHSGADVPATRAVAELSATREIVPVRIPQHPEFAQLFRAHLNPSEEAYYVVVLDSDLLGITRFRIDVLAGHILQFSRRNLREDH